MAFVETKRSGSGDRVKPGQLAWLEAGLRLGIPHECFVFAEWTLTQS